MPQPQRFALACEQQLTGINVRCGHQLQRLLLAAQFQSPFQIIVIVEVIFQSALAAAGHKNELFDASGARFIHSMLNERAIDQGQHFLGHRLGCRQKACAKTSDGEYGFTNTLLHSRLSFFTKHWAARTMRS